MNRALLIVIALVSLVSMAPAGEVYNIKVVTDATPDYTDMDSMIRSVCGKWESTKDKVWAMYYWTHLGRRQTAPMILHGGEMTDPIRQFNDYGYTMCSTVSGVNCGIWHSMGLPVKFWDISLHTVSECWYDDKWHIYDDSMSAIYTLCDGTTVASVQDVGKEGVCEASGGKKEPGHIAKYHCLYASSNNGFLTGADTPRDLAQEYRCFNPNGLKYRAYECNWEVGHRYTLNLQDGASYTRYYHRLDVPQQNQKGKAVKDGTFTNFLTGKDVDTQYYYIPNPGENPNGKPFDPERGLKIRGNGVWTFHPVLTAEAYKQSLYGQTNIAPAKDGGLTCAKTDQTAQAIFKINAANVIASQTIQAQTQGKVDFEISTNNGLTWTPAPADASQDGTVSCNLLQQVNGAYEVLLKTTLAPGAMLKGLDVQTITQVNSKTLPRLNIGKNTIYVGAGDQTDSIVLWPDCSSEERCKDVIYEKNNIAFGFSGWAYYGSIHPADKKSDASVVFKIDAPTTITSFTMGGRFSNRFEKNHVDMLYSIDGGKTWTKIYSLEDISKPYDHIDQRAQAIPESAAVQSVLFKYFMTGGSSVASVRMEVNHKPAGAQPKPLEVTFAWKERQPDRSLVARSHTQLVEKLPATYTINVAGADHPVMESMTVNLKGSSSSVQPPKYGYSDDKENADAQKFQYRWVTYGKNFAEGKSYTLSVPSGTQWGAGDPNGAKLTDGIVGADYCGGPAPSWGILWGPEQKADHNIDLDLGESRNCGAFRIHITSGWPWPEAVLHGDFTDKVELLTSTDGKDYSSQGIFPVNLWYKDIPINHMLPDNEELTGYNFELLLPKPVDCRYVRYKVTPGHGMVITEVQALDFIKYEPFDIRLALPSENVSDGKVQLAKKPTIP